MQNLTGAQKKYLRGVAHNLKPVVLVGQKHLTPQVIREIEQALSFHELIKVKSTDQKEKADKKMIAESISKETGSTIVGMIGHTIILYRQQPDPEKRKITLPPSPPEGPAESPRPTGQDDPQ